VPLINARFSHRYKEYRQRQEQEHRAWLERKKERDEKLARGEKVGPLERDPTEEVEIGLWGLTKFLLTLVLVFVLMGKFVTGSFLWEYDGKWVQLKTYLPVWQALFFCVSTDANGTHRFFFSHFQSKNLLFSDDSLAAYDGSNPELPVYVAVSLLQVFFFSGG
jgi:hypothetical protein